MKRRLFLHSSGVLVGSSLVPLTFYCQKCGGVHPLAVCEVRSLPEQPPPQPPEA
ncbi:hypothetical protein ACQ4M4_25570 [Leptolyngbya sp. AN02str]|uniref:hypothetical protein n=1 Tax=Leptolyngbya sp. AN02str TaxID=3423363 RepID=UPI003D322441